MQSETNRVTTHTVSISSLAHSQQYDAHAHPVGFISDAISLLSFVWTVAIEKNE